MTSLIAQAVEDGAVDDVIERRSRTKARPVNRVESSPEVSTPPDDDDWGGGGTSTRKRQKGKGKARNSDVRASPVPLKRKRGPGNKSMSVTPSMADEDEEIPDNVSPSYHISPALPDPPHA